MEDTENQQQMSLEAILTYTKTNSVTVWFEYSKDTFSHVVRTLKDLDQREFDNQTKLWHIPNEHYGRIKDCLQSLGFNVITKQYRPDVNIYEKDQQAIIDTKYDPSTFALIQQVDGAYWDHASEMYLLPLENLPALLDKLNNDQVNYTWIKSSNILPSRAKRTSTGSSTKFPTAIKKSKN
jgi:hypothetical protein